MTNFVLFRWILRFIRFVFWVYRKLGLPDFFVSQWLFGLTLLFNLVCLAQYFPISSNFLANFPRILAVNGIAAIAFSLLSVIFGSIYVYRLREVGISSVDMSAESGLDYRGALAMVSEGFDFLGIGASKLTSQKKEFTDALSRTGQHQKHVRILLCDPRSRAIESLERKAAVDVGRYKANVKQSFTFLQHLSGCFPDVLEIRLYNPDDADSIPPFRIMLINGELCLISQVVVGAEKEGRLLPQVHIQKKTVFGMRPNFYRAYETMFSQLWLTAMPVSEDDFLSIAQIDVTSNGMRRHA